MKNDDFVRAPGYAGALKQVTIEVVRGLINKP
jgi:hypothetical protein